MRAREARWRCLGARARRTIRARERRGARRRRSGERRADLFRTGMIYGPEYGKTAFTVPKFDEYLKRIAPSGVD